MDQMMEIYANSSHLSFTVDKAPAPPHPQLYPFVIRVNPSTTQMVNEDGHRAKNRAVMRQL